MLDLSHVPLEDLVCEIRRRRRLIDSAGIPIRALTQRVISAVCQTFGIETEEIFALTRQVRIVEPRQCAMALLRLSGTYTFAEAAGVFGLDHGTAIHALSCHRTRLTKDPAYREKIKQITRLLE